MAVHSLDIHTRLIKPTTSAADNLVTAAEFLSTEPEEQQWLVEGILPMGSLGMAGAKPKVGKTSTLLDLCVSVAIGRPFLDRYTNQGRVIYVALEEKPDELWRNLRALGASESLGDQLCLWLDPAPDDPVEWLREVVSITTPALVVIDTLQRFMRHSDLNDYASVYNALGPLQDIARTFETCILLAHHNNKVGEDSGDALLGSTALFGIIDTLISIRCRERQRLISTRQRYGADLEETILLLNEATKRVSLGSSREEAHEDEIHREMLATLDALPEPIAEADLLPMVGKGNNSDRRNALRALVGRGDVMRSGAGKRGDPYLYVSRISYPPIEGGTRYEKPGAVAEPCFDESPLACESCGLTALLELPAGGWKCLQCGSVSCGALS